MISGMIENETKINWPWKKISMPPASPIRVRKPAAFNQIILHNTVLVFIGYRGMFNDTKVKDCGGFYFKLLWDLLFSGMLVWIQKFFESKTIPTLMNFNSNWPIQSKKCFFNAHIKRLTSACKLTILPHWIWVISNNAGR